MRFTSGYVSGPYCSPTRAGLLTGRYQTRFGHEFNPAAGPNQGLPLTETTMADRYRAAGYRLVLASGTYQPVLDAFARRIGAVGLGTPLEVRDGLVFHPVKTMDEVLAVALRTSRGTAAHPFAGDTPTTASLAQ